MKSEKQQETEYAKFKAYGLKLCAKKGIDGQTIDFYADCDRTLSLSENKRIIREKLDALVADHELTKAQIEADRLKAESQQSQFMHSQIQAYNDALRAKEITATTQQIYSELLRNVRMTAKGYLPVLFIKSVPGTGKTFQSKNELLAMGYRKGTDFEIFGGNITTLELYKILHDYGHMKVIIFNDCGKLLRNHDSIDLLKEATDFGLADKDGRRMVHNYSSSEKMENYAKECWVAANLIFTFNSYEATLDLSALFDRGKLIDLALTKQDMIVLMRDIAQTAKDKETTEFLIAQYQDYGLVNFNLRLQQKCFRMRDWAEAEGRDWQAEITDEFKKNMLTEAQRIFYSFAGLRYVKQIDFARYYMQVHKASYATVKRRVAEMIELGELYSDGKEKQRLIGLQPIEA